MFKIIDNETKLLDDPLSLTYLPYVVLIANEYESFLLPFQLQEPMIYLLYHGISRLLTNMLKNFVSEWVLYREDGLTMKPATQLKLINLNKESNSKSLNLVEVGTKARHLLSASVLNETVLRKNCLKVINICSNPDSDEMKGSTTSTILVCILSFKIVST